MDKRRRKSRQTNAVGEESLVGYSKDAIPVVSAGKVVFKHVNAVSGVVVSKVQGKLDTVNLNYMDPSVACSKTSFGDCIRSDDEIPPLQLHRDSSSNNKNKLCDGNTSNDKPECEDNDQTFSDRSATDITGSCQKSPISAVADLKGCVSGVSTTMLISSVRIKEELPFGSEFSAETSEEMVNMSLSKKAKRERARRTVVSTLERLPETITTSVKQITETEVKKEKLPSESEFSAEIAEVVNISLSKKAKKEGTRKRTVMSTPERVPEIITTFVKENKKTEVKEEKLPSKSEFSAEIAEVVNMSLSKKTKKEGARKRTVVSTLERLPETITIFVQENMETETKKEKSEVAGDSVIEIKKPLMKESKERKTRKRTAVAGNEELELQKSHLLEDVAETVTKQNFATVNEKVDKDKLPTKMKEKKIKMRKQAAVTEKQREMDTEDSVVQKSRGRPRKRAHFDKTERVIEIKKPVLNGNKERKQEGVAETKRVDETGYQVCEDKGKTDKKQATVIETEKEAKIYKVTKEQAKKVKTKQQTIISKTEMETGQSATVRHVNKVTPKQQITVSKTEKEVERNQSTAKRHENEKMNMKSDVTESEKEVETDKPAIKMQENKEEAVTREAATETEKENGTQTCVCVHGDEEVGKHASVTEREQIVAQKRETGKTRKQTVSETEMKMDIEKPKVERRVRKRGAAVETERIDETQKPVIQEDKIGIIRKLDFKDIIETGRKVKRDNPASSKQENKIRLRKNAVATKTENEVEPVLDKNREGNKRKRVAINEPEMEMERAVKMKKPILQEIKETKLRKQADAAEYVEEGKKPLMMETKAEMTKKTGYVAETMKKLGNKLAGMRSLSLPSKIKSSSELSEEKKSLCLHETDSKLEKCKILTAESLLVSTSKDMQKNESNKDTNRVGRNKVGSKICTSKRSMSEEVVGKFTSEGKMKKEGHSKISSKEDVKNQEVSESKSKKKMRMEEPGKGEYLTEITIRLEKGKEIRKSHSMSETVTEIGFGKQELSNMVHAKESETTMEMKKEETKKRNIAKSHLEKKSIGKEAFVMKNDGKTELKIIKLKAFEVKTEIECNREVPLQKESRISEGNESLSATTYNSKSPAAEVEVESQKKPKRKLGIMKLLPTGSKGKTDIQGKLETKTKEYRHATANRSSHTRDQRGHLPEIETEKNIERAMNEVLMQNILLVASKAKTKHHKEPPGMLERKSNSGRTEKCVKDEKKKLLNKASAEEKDAMVNQTVLVEKTKTKKHSEQLSARKNISEANKRGLVTKTVAKKQLLEDIPASDKNTKVFVHKKVISGAKKNPSAVCQVAKEIQKQFVEVKNQDCKGNEYKKVKDNCLLEFSLGRKKKTGTRAVKTGISDVNCVSLENHSLRPGDMPMQCKTQIETMLNVPNAEATETTNLQQKFVTSENKEDLFGDGLLMPSNKNVPLLQMENSDLKSTVSVSETECSDSVTIIMEESCGKLDFNSGEPVIREFYSGEPVVRDFYSGESAIGFVKFSSDTILSQNDIESDHQNNLEFNVQNSFTEEQVIDFDMNSVNRESCMNKIHLVENKTENMDVSEIKNKKYETELCYERMSDVSKISLPVSEVEKPFADDIRSETLNVSTIDNISFACTDERVGKEEELDLGRDKKHSLVMFFSNVKEGHWKLKNQGSSAAANPQNEGFDAKQSSGILVTSKDSLTCASCSNFQVKAISEYQSADLHEEVTETPVIQECCCNFSESQGVNPVVLDLVQNNVPSSDEDCYIIEVDNDNILHNSSPLLAEVDGNSLMVEEVCYVGEQSYGGAQMYECITSSPSVYYADEERVVIQENCHANISLTSKECFTHHQNSEIQFTPDMNSKISAESRNRTYVIKETQSGLMQSMDVPTVSEVECCASTLPECCCCIISEFKDLAKIQNAECYLSFSPQAVMPAQLLEEDYCVIKNCHSSNLTRKEGKFQDKSNMLDTEYQIVQKASEVGHPSQSPTIVLTSADDCNTSVKAAQSEGITLGDDCCIVLPEKVIAVSPSGLTPNRQNRPKKRGLEADKEIDRKIHRSSVLGLRSEPAKVQAFQLNYLGEAGQNEKKSIDSGDSGKVDSDSLLNELLRHAKETTHQNWHSRRRSSKQTISDLGASACVPLGKLVWAQLGGQKFWPGVVINPSLCGQKSLKPGCAWVFWFGDHKISEIPMEKIVPFARDFSKKYLKSSGKMYQAAVVEALKECSVRLSGNVDAEEISKNWIVWAQKVLPKASKDLEDACQNLSPWILKQLEQLRLTKLEADSEGNSRRKSEIAAVIPEESPQMKCITDICIACGNTSVESERSHPFFEGGICCNCRANLIESIFYFGKDGTNSYCIICGNGNKVFVCEATTCNKVYCFDCIQRLMGDGALDIIKQTNDWNCFLCTPYDPPTHGLLKSKKEWKANLSLLFQRSNASLQMQPNNLCRHSIRVLSLFDGIATGKLVLNRLNFQVEKYFASEIDQDAIMVGQIRHAGSIDYVGDIEELEGHKLSALGPIDLLIGGSPCNELSVANPSRRGLGDGSGLLFFEFHRILSVLQMQATESRPLFWLYENVASMTDESRSKISRFFQCDPALWDAKYLSAQRRARYFWGNIPGMYCPLQYSRSEAITNLNESLFPTRNAKVEKIRTITTRSNSLLQEKNKDSYPVSMGDNGDTLWIPEVERIFGFPEHYTDVANLSTSRRLKLLGQSWSVPVICHLLSPLCDYFQTTSNSTVISLDNSVANMCGENANLTANTPKLDAASDGINIQGSSSSNLGCGTSTSVASADVTM